jgi:hypothetical protein
LPAKHRSYLERVGGPAVRKVIARLDELDRASGLRPARGTQDK